MSKKKFMREKDLQIIALDYLKLTGAKDLKELEIKHSYYYNKFIEEKGYLIKGENNGEKNKNKTKS